MSGMKLPNLSNSTADYNYINSNVNEYQVQLELNTSLATNNVEGENHLDDDNVHIVWNDSNDWYENEYNYDYDSMYSLDLLQTCINNARKSSSNVLSRVVSWSNLKDSQIIAHDIFVLNVSNSIF